MGKTLKKLLVICGPTATGKTSLAGYLAKKFDGELVSADSRQVYEGLDIGTGKEWIEGVKIWGYDLVSPKEEFSVSHFQKFAREKIKEIWERGRLPVLVGGTGFYIRAVVDGIQTISVPKDEGLRKRLESKSVDELFEILLEKDKKKAFSLNNSDRKNKRRLVRAIEVSGSKNSTSEEEKFTADTLFIGLIAQKDFLFERIQRRVLERLKMGMAKEIEKLKSIGVSSGAQSMQTPGYAGEDKEEWTKKEFEYAKRQVVWFKKDKRINWFDISDSDFTKKIEKMVQKWYI